jgi:SAM-dependent methyltransferase
MLHSEPREILGCPRCHTEVIASGSGVSCSNCRRHYSLQNGFLDFAPEIPVSSVREQPGAAQRYMEDPQFIDEYVRSKRAFFVKVMGNTWGSRFTCEDEDGYIREFVQPAAGPVLDLACGPGQRTQCVARMLGAARVIGLDLSFPMLEAARQAVPRILLIRGSALAMPIRTASLGAILCWNALQLFPDPERVIAEVGRCLRPGGTFTCFTYRKATGPYRIIQQGWERVMRGVEAFSEEELRTWLQQANLTVLDLRGPRLILRFSAGKF